MPYNAKKHSIKKPTRIPEYVSSRFKIRILMELPAGVIIPPISPPLNKLSLTVPEVRIRSVIIR
ncbi:MAG: hypothetical protein AVO34_10575 [Firmicutes bacterium ML8_F2]|nr:MAG: hypothetical protein AVO34_10575 [Firmicutes bacterium ML8_F2]